MADETRACCSANRPDEWDQRELTWEAKPFVKDRVRSLLHIPLNFGSVLKRNLQKAEAAGALPDEMLLLTDENSLWGADLYLAVSKDVPGAKMSTLSGTYLTRVFEGPYRDIPKWIAEMKRYVASQGKTVKSLLLNYRTCPKCAQKFGKNYVVLLARV